MVALLATAHGILPLLLLYALGPLLGPVQILAVILFWSWPVWLWPLAQLRGGPMLAVALPLVVSALALLAAALPMLLFTIGLLGGKFHI